MPLHPQARAFLDAIATGSMSSPGTLSPLAHRMQHAQEHERLAGLPVPVAHVTDRPIPGPDTPIPVRIYTPSGIAPYSILVWYHGGGFTTGSLESADPTCRLLANASGFMVVSVAYRLAPEHKFPAAMEDAVAAAEWVMANVEALGGDPRRVCVGGDSAGGNLAAVVCLRANHRRGPAFAGQLLVYPLMQFTAETASRRANGEGYFLTRQRLDMIKAHYLPGEADGLNPFAAPSFAPDVSGLPPALIITAEFDPLLDEGEAYGARLREAGVSTTITRYDGMVHGFFSRSQIMDAGKDAIREAAGFLQTLQPVVAGTR